MIRRVRKVEARKPPKRVMETGAKISLPSPFKMDKGIRARIVVDELISIGLRRVAPASIIASVFYIPLLRS